MKEETTEVIGGGQQKGSMENSNKREAHNSSSNNNNSCDYEEMGEGVSRVEVWGWYLYEFCSYFVQTLLIPVVFPLIISQLQHLSVDPVQEWFNNHPGVPCADKEIRLYNTLTKRSISVGSSNFSSLEWTSIAWGGGLAIATPILAFVSFLLNSAHFQTLIPVAATGFGVFFCFPAGFFKTTKIFIPYIAFIVVASTIASASHTHHFGLMIHALGSPSLKRLRVSSRFSLYATVAGCLGSAIIASLTYHMLREPNERDFISLWIVSIFGGLLWLAGVSHAFIAQTRTTPLSSSRFQLFSIFKHPNAIGGLVSVFLSSFATMCIFTGGVLFIVGQLCVRPVHLLYFWLTYFLFPLISLPLLHPLQHLIKTNSVKMKILGFMLSLLSTGFGFYFRDSDWKWSHVLIFCGIQGTASGLLHAFGRVLVLDCAPSGKESAFSVWYAWVRSVGLCVGFTVASVVPGHIRTSFGAAFCAALVGIVVLLFGNVSDRFDGDGDGASRHVKQDREMGFQ